MKRTSKVGVGIGWNWNRVYVCFASQFQCIMFNLCSGPVALLNSMAMASKDETNVSTTSDCAAAALSAYEKKLG